MNSQWNNPLSEKLWHKMKFDAKNNLRTPLGLISLMINAQYDNEQVQTLNDEGMSL